MCDVRDPLCQLSHDGVRRVTARAGERGDSALNSSSSLRQLHSHEDTLRGSFSFLPPAVFV